MAPDHHVEAYILDDGLDAYDRKNVQECVSARICLHWVPAEVLPEGLLIWGRMSQTTYQKLLLGKWLPNSVQRVVWLDCDLLVVGDVAALWNSATTNRIVCAAADQRVPTVSSKFGVAAYRDLNLNPQAKYFNAGVLLIDLSRWRNEDVAGRAFQYLHKYRDRVYFWDQEALNAVLTEEWEEISAKWNWHPLLNQFLNSTGKRKTTGIPFREDPQILHFSGNLKPWLYRSDSLYWAQYYRYVDQTPWAGSLPERNLKGALLAWYESTFLRPWLYPLERWATSIVRAFTAKYSRNESR